MKARYWESVDMMSQMTNGIFATPGQIAPLPAARQARSLQGHIQLVVTDANGQALQSWVLKQNKATLGSSETCNLCCNLPGIAPVHALIVTGSRQTFVRSLAGKLSQDGIPTSELLLSENQTYFELAGYRFALIRKEATQTRQEKIQNQRMRFALARPLAVLSPTETRRETQPDEPSMSAPWVANVIREAIEPLEAQIESLLLPLAEFQAQTLQAQISASREVEEEKAKAAEKERASREIEEQRAKAAEKERSKKEVEIVNLVAQQSANMEVLTERLSDVNSQLTSIERIIAQDAELNANSKAETNQIVSVQQTAIEQLQVGMVSVSESIKLLQQQQQAAQSENLSWKNEVQQQLQQLTSAVTGLSEAAQNRQQPEILEAIASLKQTHELAQYEIQRWQVGVQHKLDALQDKLEQTPQDNSEQVQSQLAFAITEIQSKHEQTLAELQSWKTELRDEIHDLLRAAVQAVEQRPAIVSTAPIVSPAACVPQDLSPAWTVENHDSSINNHVIPGSFAPLVDDAESSAQSFVEPYVETFVEPYVETSAQPIAAPVDQLTALPVTQSTFEPSNQTYVEPSSHQTAEPLSWHGYDQISAEIVSDEMVQIASQQLSHQSFESQEVTNLQADQDNPWPTLQVASDQTLSSPLFSDQWNSSDSSDILENQSATTDPNPSWVLPEEDHQFSPPKTHAPIEPAYRQSKVEPETVSPSSDQDVVGGSNHEFGLRDLFPEANWSTDSEPVFNAPTPSHVGSESPATSAGASPTHSVSISTQPEQDSHSPIEPTHTEPKRTELEHTDTEEPQQKLTESGLPSWWTNTVEETSVSVDEQVFEAAQQTSKPASELDISQLLSDVQSTIVETSATESQAQPASETHGSVQNQPHSQSSSMSSLDRFVERERNLRSELIEPTAKIDSPASDEPEFNWHEPAYSDSHDNSSQAAFGTHRPSQNHFSAKADDELIYGQESHHAEVTAVTPRSPAQSFAPAPTSAKPVEEEEESVESYMKNLLARMRGEPGESAPQTAPIAATIAQPTAPARPSPYELRNAMKEQSSQGENEEPMDLDKYVPLTNAPEKTKHISALRDLANSNARTAIHKSTRRRTLSGSLMKFAISAIAITVAAALFAINGVAVNIALVATMAALFVALIWGYDGLKSLKPLLQNTLVLQPTEVENEVDNEQTEEQEYEEEQVH